MFAMQRAGRILIMLVLSLAGFWPQASALAEEHAPASARKSIRVALRDSPRLEGIDPVALSRQVKIYRDQYGVPHIEGKTDEAALVRAAREFVEANDRSNVRCHLGGIWIR